jgi:putative permease
MRDTRILAARTVWLVAVAVAVGVGGYAIRHTLSIFVLAFVLAYLLDPLVVMLEQRGYSRPRGVLLLYVVFGVAAFYAAIVVIPFVGLKWQYFLADLPTHLEKARSLVAGWRTRFVPLAAASGWSWLIDTLSAQAESATETVCSGAYATAASVLFNTVNVILAPILAFFMLIYKVKAADGLLMCIPMVRRRMVADLGHEINASIGGYLRGQLLVSLIVAVLSVGALFLLGIDYPILNGIFAGLASILPFVGVIIATIPPLFFAYVKFQSLAVIGKVTLVFAVIYFIEGYVIKPLVFKKAMEMNPLTTIIAVMVGGEVLGFWGILLAIPLAAAVRIVIEHARKGDFRREGDHDTTSC